jgi:uncharacterized protein (DUF1810 family)
MAKQIMRANNISLQKFIEAQERDYHTAFAEIKTGSKRSHWMWYIFPQIEGLGFSGMSKRFAIRGLQEAAAYLAHPWLGRRLLAISNALLDLPDYNATVVMGSPDDMKLRSSMTLFSLVPGSSPVFEAVLQKYFHGQKDTATIQLI